MPGTILPDRATPCSLAEGYVAGEAARARAVKGLAARSRCTSWSAPGRVALAPAGGRRAGLDAVRRPRRRAGAASPRAGLARRRSRPDRRRRRRARRRQVAPVLGVHPLAPHRGWLVLRAARSPTARPRRYLPVIDLLKSYFRIEPRDDAATIREKVTGKLLDARSGARADPAGRCLRCSTSPSRTPRGSAWIRPQRRQRTLDAVKRLLLRESQVQPLLLVFEDLHWIDTETQALLDSLVESLPTARMLLLVNYRPEYRHALGQQDLLPPAPARPAAARERRGAARRAARRPIRRSTPLKRLLIERTEGNPFFLEESVRALVETGVAAASAAPIAWRRPLEHSRCRRRSRRSWPPASTGSRPRTSGCSRRRR